MVILGLGSNKGDRAAMLGRAVEMLAPILTDLRRSSIYETKALLPEGASSSWDMAFLNMAAAGETKLSAQELLVAIKDIEKNLGREAAERWAPREIDIDILAMDDVQLNIPGLRIPHPGLLEREFALLPLVELAPDWRYPGGEYKDWKAADIALDKGFALPKKRAVNG